MPPTLTSLQLYCNDCSISQVADRVSDVPNVLVLSELALVARKLDAILCGVLAAFLKQSFAV